ncbi:MULTISPECIES: hypothetical protein [Streptomyces microflavus subgroup]|uniref:Uncharacterized protein n=1 Tax=Streptomyces microflavus TaxID=1919 RepID=A0A7H8MGJ0_STRMI|nr:MULTISPECIES: hypothetical protein [Streptomyces microflavus subgroup]QKW41072.1 hypothetical protein HUT09_00070 [Streptomyces microflavus]
MPITPTATTVKVMALIIGVLAGVIGALVAVLLSRHLGATGMESTGYSTLSFVGTAMFVYFLEEKLGLI